MANKESKAESALLKYEYTNSPESCTRVWQHATHEETMFNETGNFFLIAEAMLLVFYATLSDDVRPWALLSVSILGLALTVMWYLINIRQEAELTLASKRLVEYCPEYLEFKDERDAMGKFRKARPILSKGVPIVVMLTWLTLVLEITL